MPEVSTNLLKEFAKARKAILAIPSVKDSDFYKLQRSILSNYVPRDPMRFREIVLNTVLGIDLWKGAEAEKIKTSLWSVYKIMKSYDV